MKECLSCKNCFDQSNWECPRCRENPVFDRDFPLFAPELCLENEGFPEEVFIQLYELESSHFWFRARNDLITWAIKKYFPELKNFLEIGCGTGFVLKGIKKAFPDIQIFGSEIYSKGLILTKQRLPEMNLFQMDARHIPFRDEFDLIGAFDVLEHIEEDEEVLLQLRKAVKQNGGGLILTVPQHRFLWSKLDEYSCHFRRYEREQLIELVTGAGFEILHSTSFVSLLMPIMLVSRRLMSQKREKDFDPLSELRINKSLNYLLETVMRLEQISIKAGVSYGIGGSLLLLARAK